jgi:hypothetical protein
MTTTYGRAAKPDRTGRRAGSRGRAHHLLVGWAVTADVPEGSSRCTAAARLCNIAQLRVVDIVPPIKHPSA